MSKSLIARSLLVVLMVAATASVAARQPAHIESPPSGISPRIFALEYSGCLGPLRSALARTVGFSADFNPGKHQGTVGEEEFLKAAFEFETDADLEAFCSSFD